MSNCSAAWGAEVIHQRAGDQLAALVTSYLRGRTGVGGLEEADQHTTGRPGRAVVQHHVELVVEAGTKPLRICSRQYGVGEDPDNPESFPVRRRAAVFAVHSKLLLRVVTEEWHVFKDQLSRVEQSYAAELRYRPRWAQGDPFSSEDRIGHPPLRVLDTETSSGRLWGISGVF
jgi:hypothetical protein